ncbi:MAG: glycerol-3-phosphate O-acyltransferase / dihydroxyacetone phosphate acyltransferase [Blastocatellia bacterium]|nr:glycerol-3-phosphate O-acyltransferase / dihydroxyacetone phosphate acyltransferase [Blastocatellia bacterium]
MIRRAICLLLRFALRVYFRRIEVAGLEHIPLDTPLIFVLNHPNALVDPVFLLCLTPRRVSFLAKAPLFRMPVLGYLVRALDSLPVYRSQDEGEATSRNIETFALARNLLARGGTLAICPEGVSHDEPRLKPLKTGAARIALGTVSSGESLDLKIVPAGLYYTAKSTFRSSALLYFGEPIDVVPAALDGNGNPSRQATRALSDQIEGALRNVILEAEHKEALALIEKAEQMFFAEEPDNKDEPRLAREMKLRRQFLEGFALHRAKAPQRLALLEARMARFEQELEQAGLDPRSLSPPDSALGVFAHVVTRTIGFLLLLPFALFGIVVHFPAYTLGGYLARRFSQQGEDVISTIKIISAMLLFPATWIVLALVLWRFVNWQVAVAVTVLAPLCGYVAIRFFEELDRFAGGISAVALFVMRRRFFVRLLAERNAIRKEILELGEESALVG